MLTLVNVCGAGRSGTTVIDLMLGNASDAFSCGEVYAWFRPWRRHHFRIVCSCLKDPCPVWETIKNLPEKVFHREVFKQLNVNFVIDSSKELSWVIDANRWAGENRIRTINLVMWKNPISLAYSHWKRGRGLEGWRNTFLDWYKQFFQVGLPFISVYYNDLAANPSGKLKEICRKIGMEYFEGKERFWEKQHHHLFGSLGVRNQITSNNVREVKSSEDFHPEFITHLNPLRATIESDIAVQKIMEKLKASEVSLLNGLSYNDNTQKNKVYPMWYYLNKFKRVYKKRFPAPWPYDQ